MKRKRSFQLLATSFAIILAGGSLMRLSVNAGLSVTNSSIVTENSELNLSEWYNPNDDLSCEDGAIVFTEEDNKETRLISKFVTVADKYYEDLVEVNMSVRFKEIPKGESFILAVGLSGIEAMYGEPGNVEVHFRDNGGLTAEVIEYNEDGDKIVVIEEKKCGNLTASNKVNLHITVEGQLKLTVNAKKMGSAKLQHVPSGQIGLLQSGKCQAQVTELITKIYKYDRPENSNVTEDFESGTINDNCFTSIMQSSARWLSGLSVEDIDGNKVLRFRNTGVGYFGTKQEYSNFEFSFDIPYFAREYEYDEYDTTVVAPSGEFGVSFGDFAADVSGQDYTQSTDLILFTSSVSGYLKGGWKADITEFLKEETNEGYSVKLRMEDAKLTVYIKSLSSNSWKEMVTHTYDNFKSGYIKIWSTRDTNFAIDNVKLENLDKDPNLVEIEYKSAIIEQPDFDYTPAEMVFKEEVKEEEVDFNWMYIVIGATTIAAIILSGGIVANYILRKKKKSEEEKA